MTYKENSRYIVKISVLNGQLVTHLIELNAAHDDLIVIILDN